MTAATPTIASSAAANAAGPLTNLAHLDFLTDRVAVTDKAEHSTYRLAADPKVGVLWVYAKAGAHGKFARVGGGAYDPARNTYGQGAFDADDIARAAMVYLRQWRATGDKKAKDQAYQLLRGLTYLQTQGRRVRGESAIHCGSVQREDERHALTSRSPHPRPFIGCAGC